jgi:hypothetical protein
MSARAARIGTLTTICVACLAAWAALPVAAQSTEEKGQSRRRAGKAERARVERKTPKVVEEIAIQAEKKQKTRRKKELPPGVPTVRFEATVFKVHALKGRIVNLDARKLAAAKATPAGLAKALAEFGDTEVLYRIDQRVGADGTEDVFELTRDVPYVSGSVTATAGHKQLSVARTKVGVTYEVTCYFPDEANRRHMHVSLEFGLSDVTRCDLDVGEGIASPTFWRVKQRHHGMMEVGKPTVLVSITGPAGDNGKCVAFVSLVKLGNLAD